jgi:hypothetical protein
VIIVSSRERCMSSLPKAAVVDDDDASGAATRMTGLPYKT